MKLHKGHIWLRLNELIEAGIPERSIHDWKAREEVEQLQDGGVYLPYSSLRPSWQEQVRKHLGAEPIHIYRYELIEPVYKHTDKRDIESYELPDGTRLEQVKRRELIEACAFLAWISEARKKLDTLGLQKMREFWDMCQGYVAYKQLALPASRRLERKYAEYAQHGALALVPSKHGNRNAAKIGELQVALLIELMADGRKFSKREVCRQFKAIAKEKGWAAASASDQCLYNYINMNRGQWELGRHGAKFHMLNRELVINQRRVSQPHLQWQADGTPAALWYRADNGQISKLYVLMVMDSHSMAAVGYAIGETEQTQLVAEAMKMALKTQGKRPWELRTDRGSSFSSGDGKSLLKGLGIKWKPSAVGRARSRTIEMVQGWWMERVTSYYLNKSGMNLTATHIDSKQNPDFFKSNISELPSKEELAAQIRQSIAIWNNTKGGDGRTPAERLADPATQAVDFASDKLIEVFGVWRKRGKKLLKYQFKVEGLEFQLGGQVFKYLPLASTSDLQAKLLQELMFVQDFYIRYDPTDMEQIALYQLPVGKKEKEENLRFWGYAQIKGLSAQLLAEASDAEKAAYAKQREIQKAQSKWVLEQQEQRRAILAANNVLTGAIEHNRVHKEAANKAKLELQRLEALGYEGMGAQQEREQLAEDIQAKPLRSINIYSGRYKD